MLDKSSSHASSVGPYQQFNLWEFYIFDVANSFEGDKMLAAMEVRIQSIASVLEECIRIKEEADTAVLDTIRSGIYLKYYPNIVVPEEYKSGHNFKAIIWYNPDNMSKFEEAYNYAQEMCELYSTERVVITMQPIK